MNKTMCNKCKWFEGHCIHPEGECITLESDGRRPDSVEFSSMKEDAMRRDLTMNALFFDPISEEIFDFTHGEKDLMNGLVKFVGSPKRRIEEDKLRMLRAIRFTSKFDFKLDEASWGAIKKHAGEIDSVSQERIHDEMNKMLMAPKPSIGIEMLRASGLLEPILPEVEKLWRCEQAPKWHSEGSVGVHSMMTLDAVRKETDNVILLWAALLHDIGKPATFTIEDGMIKAHGHDKAGAEIARDILNRLRFSSKETNDIVWLVENHMRIKYAKEMKKSTLRRLVADERLDSLVIVSKADTESAICAEPCLTKLDWVEKVKSFVGTLEDQIELPEPLISGRHLIDMGFKPGPLFKEILNHISELQLGEEITTFEEALTIAKNW